jgi:hypothetical protein
MPNEFECAYCHKPVQPKDPSAQLNAGTGEWEHRDCAKTLPQLR